MVTLETHIAACTSDIYDAAASGTYTLDMQVRAYDLLDYILAMKETGIKLPSSHAAEDFRKAYQENRARLMALVDEAALKQEAQTRLQSYMSELEEAEAKAEAAEALHELAKETFGIWQSSGIFARQRALRRLRKSAGFRLESHRIGNYVSKTYDLMEEARRVCQRARQAMFSANMTYKCKADAYELIAQEL